VDIVADAKGVGRGVGEAERKFGGLGSSVAKVGKAVAIGAVAVGAGAVVIGRSLIQAGERASTANARIGQINDSMGLFGKQTDQVTGRVVKYGEALARQTGVETNSIKATQAKLLTFKDLAATADQLGGNFDRATTAAVDLAAAGFGTAETNAAQLGKALQDPIKGLTALSRSGVTFTDVEKERIATLVESGKAGEAQALVLSAIETQVGGTAAATSNASDKMKVGYEQLKEQLGQKLLPVFNQVGEFVTTKLIPKATELGGALADKLGPAVSRVGEFITGRLVPAARSIYGWFIDKIVPGIRGYLTPILEGVRGAFGSVSGAIQDNSGNLEKLGRFIKSTAEFASKYLLPVIGTLLGGAFRVLGKAIGIAISALAGIVGIIDTVIRKVRELVSAIGNSPVGKLVGALFSSGHTPLLAPSLMGPSSLGTGPSGGLAGPSRFAWSPFGPSGMTGLASGTAGPLVLDQRTVEVNVRVDGALDPVAVAHQLEGILDRSATRLGRVTSYGAGR
jgi:hypothetical protein